MIVDVMMFVDQYCMIMLTVLQLIQAYWYLTKQSLVNNSFLMLH